MKKIKGFTLIILGLFLFSTGVSALSYNTPVSSDMSYTECIDFQSSAVNTTGNGYFGHCIKATCYSGVWETQYYISNNMVKCSNGNPSKYYLLMNSGCGNYTGSCTPSTKVKYCNMVAYYDCGKTSSGNPFTTTTTTTIPPLTTPTKSSTTSSKRTTQSTTTRKTSSKVPTTTGVKSNNNYLSSLEVNPGKIEFDKIKENYNLEVEEGITKIEIIAVVEDSEASYIVENNENINLETPIKITVTAEDGTVKVYTINLKRPLAILDSNSKLGNIKIENHDLDFDPDIFSYTIKVKEEKSLDISVRTESSKSTYSITGNKDLKNKSKIIITVIAEDLTETPYIINIKKSSNITGIIIVVLIVGVAGFVGYKVFRKLTSKQEENRYEYE